MESKPDHLITLLNNWRNEASAEDLRVLDEWLDESAENRQFASDLRLIWEKSAGYTPELPEIDESSAYLAVRQKAGLEAEVATRKVSRIAWLLRAAAALLVLAGVVWFIYRPASVEMREIVAENAILEYELPDQSHIWLRKGSVLRFPAAFSGAQRKVQLEGDAFFEVTHRPDQPFIVETTSGNRIEVLGTAFGVNTRNESGVVTVWVKSGKVRFQPQKGSKSIVLNGGVQADFDTQSKKIHQEETLNGNSFSWQSGGLAFINTPLEVVIRDIERFYGVKVELQNLDLKNCRYTATAPFNNQPVEKVLADLSYAFKFNLKKSGSGNYLLRGGQCD